MPPAGAAVCPFARDFPHQKRKFFALPPAAMNVWNDWNVLNRGNVPNVWNVWNVWNGGNVLPQNVPKRSWQKETFQTFLSFLSFLDAAKSPRRQKPAEAVGGPGGIRTLDLSDANRTLSQLSYRPLWRAGRADLAVRPCALRLVYYTSFWPKCQADFCGDFLFGLPGAKNEAGCPLPGRPALSVCLRVTRSASFCPGASCRRSWR